MPKTPKTFTINIKPPEPIDIEKQNAIKKIDKTIFKRSIENGLQLKQAQTINDYILNPITKGNIKESYLLNHKSQNEANAQVNGSKMLSNPKIQKTIEEVLTDNDITKNSIIQTHKQIQTEALADKDFTNARETNRDFMRITGILKNDNTTPIIAVQVVNNIAKMQPDEIDNTLNELLKE